MYADVGRKSIVEYADRLFRFVRVNRNPMTIWMDGQRQDYDFICPDTCHRVNLIRTAIGESDFVACEPYLKKRVIYASLMPAFRFAPIAADTRGTLGDNSIY